MLLFPKSFRVLTSRFKVPHNARLCGTSNKPIPAPLFSTSKFTDPKNQFTQQFMQQGPQRYFGKSPISIPPKIDFSDTSTTSPCWVDAWESWRRKPTLLMPEFSERYVDTYGLDRGSPDRSNVQVIDIRVTTSYNIPKTIPITTLSFAGEVQAITINDREDEIIIQFSGNTLEMVACADCCSESWFLFPEQIGGCGFASLIGKRILRLEKTPHVKLDLPPSNRQEVDIYNTYAFILEDNTTIPFVLGNSSNGWYDGDLYLCWHNDILPEPMFFPPSASLTVIVGLPACGKSSYAKKYLLKTHFIIDDRFDYFTTLTFDNIYKGIPTCWIASQFTDFSIYSRYIQLVLPFLGPDKITTLCFTPNIQQSLENNKSRNDQFMKYKENDIHRMGTYYNPLENPYLNKQLISNEGNM